MSVNEAVDGQCHYYLIKKHRYCRFQPKEGQQYCPEHACMKGIHGKRKRIPCPLNPSHNCYEDDLEKHVRKCNVTKAQKVTQEASYYVRGINKGLVMTQSVNEPQESKKVCVKDLTSVHLAAMIARVNKLYEDHVEKVETAVYEHPCVREEYCGCADGDLGKALGEQAAVRKELLQQASLIGQLDELGFLSGGHCFVEMGAGKGKLSHWIQKASKECANNSFLLIERSSVRYKMDSFHKLGGAESEFKRIKIDIEDICLGHVEMVNSSNSVVVVGKHLCGGATDMGIRCAVQTLGIQKTAHHSSLSRSENNDLTSGNENTVKQIHCPEISLSEKISSPCLEASENVKNKSSKNVSDMNKLSAVGIEVSLVTSSDSRCFRHSLEGMPDNHTQEEKLAGDEDRRLPTFSNTVTVSNPNTDHMQEEKLNPHEDRTTTMHKDRVMDTNRRESDPASSEDEQTPPAKTPKLASTECEQKLPRGIMIALCCHHTCTWETYLGQEFMHACGVSPQEFDLLTRLSSWATCAKITAKSTKNRKNNEESAVLQKSFEPENKQKVAEVQDKTGPVLKVEDHETADLINLEASKSLREQIRIPEREAIGWKCKRLIDTGRLHYLRSKGMKCSLRIYINEEFTPENVVLIAHSP